MDTRATLQQAIHFHRQLNLAEAEHLYRTVLQHEPLNAAALHNLGLIAGSTGHFGPAMELVAQSLQLDPGNIAYRNNQIGLFDAAGQRQMAEDSAKRLVADRPDDLRIRADYARLLVKYGKHPLAAVEWDHLHKKVPDDFAVCFHYADTLEAMGKLEGAETLCREALRIKPDSREATMKLGGILMRTNRRDEGVQLLEQAARLEPTNGGDVKHVP